MRVLKEEEFVGISRFYTEGEGVGGKLRFIPEDFKVMETPKELPRDENGNFLILSVTAKNWETNKLIRELSKALHISRNRIGFAGTKDKRAVTTQLLSVYHPNKELPDVNIRDVSVKVLYRSNKGLEIGDLSGNRFEVVIRLIDGDKKGVEHKVKALVDELLTLGGFPNFYGIQRFGVIRPVTHLVGKHIVGGNLEKAVDLYLTYFSESESEEEKYARKRFARERDANEALSYFPKNLIFERAILNELVKKPEDYVSALKVLPKNLLLMFVFAYQSYLFNLMLSRRIKEGLPINSAVVGDLIAPFAGGEYEDKFIPVTKRNLDRVNKAIGKGKAAVTGVLVGYSTPFADGAMGEIEHGVVEEEGLDEREFIIPEIPFLSSPGGRRALLSPFFDFKWSYGDDELNDKKLAVKMSFTLRKGCYATSLLREFMKAEDIRCY